MLIIINNFIIETPKFIYFLFITATARRYPVTICYLASR